MRKPRGKYQDAVIQCDLVKSRAEPDYITEFDSVHKRESLIFR